MVRPTIKTEPSCSSPLIISDDEIDSFTSPSENSSDTKQGSGPVKQEFLDTTDGLAEASNILGHGVKELVQAVQKLRDLGIEDLVLPLPKIVVVGDQSTGKSSLIEGMSEIKVPRDTGTCTRCPLEINLSENTDTNALWTCKVSLFKKYIYEGVQGKFCTAKGRPSSAKSEGATRARPLGPWILQDGENLHFATLTSKSQVSEVLRLAQLATLNPSKPFQDYIPGAQGGFENSNQVQFSPNVVRLEISGPDLPNLSFYDLPGVINVSEVAEEEYLVDLVKNLVKEYIKADNCINILAIPMTDDPANSTAFDLIRKVKAENRTIGVLTKPDRVQNQESFDQWRDILEGTKYVLGFGYFAVKNNPDTSVDHATARTEERQFFNQEPWSTELEMHKARFGTRELQTALSHKLTTQIKANLPSIVEKVRLKAVEIDAKLSKIPEPVVGNIPLKILEKVLEFEREVQLQIDGGSAIHPFRKLWKNYANEFIHLLKKSRPRLVMQECISLDSEDEAVHAPSTGKRQREAEVEQVSCKRSASAVRDTPEKEPSWEIPVLTNLPPINGRKFTLLEIRNIRQDAYVGLPCGVHPKATERMIEMSLESWEKPLNGFLRKTTVLCQRMADRQINETFGDWQRTPLFNQINEISESFMKTLFIDLGQTAKRLYSLEISRPVAFNSESLNICVKKSLNELQDSRREWLAWKLVEKEEARNPRLKSSPHKEEKVAKMSEAQIGPDPCSKEIELMGNVQGYYEYASSRFVDNVCLTIFVDLFNKYRDGIGGKLKEDIGLTKADAHIRCANSLVVDIESQNRRLQLEKERSAISEALKSLSGLTGNISS